MYAYPFIFDRNKEANISDSTFKLKVYITKTIIDTLFNLYDADKIKDNLEQIKDNITVILRYQNELSPGIFPYDFDKTCEYVQTNIINKLYDRSFNGEVKSKTILENSGLKSSFKESDIKQEQPFESTKEVNVSELISTSKDLNQKLEIKKTRSGITNTISFNHFLNVFYNPNDRSGFKLNKSESGLTDNLYKLFNIYFKPTQKFILANKIKNLTNNIYFDTISKLNNVFNLNNFDNMTLLQESESEYIDLYKKLMVNTDIQQFTFNPTAYSVYLNYNADPKWIDIQAHLLNHYLYTCQVLKMVTKTLDYLNNIKNQNSDKIINLITEIYKKKILNNSFSEVNKNIVDYLKLLHDKTYKDNDKEITDKKILNDLKEKFVEIFKDKPNNTFQLTSILDRIILSKHIPIIENFSNPLEYSNIYTYPPLSKKVTQLGALRVDFDESNKLWESGNSKEIVTTQSGGGDVNNSYTSKNKRNFY